jgi:hypothetical protein
MPYVDFPALQALKPAAFKLYIYGRPQAERTGTYTWSLPRHRIGRERGLHVHSRWRYPAAQHGVDGTLRRALEEVIAQGFLEKTGQRSRCPKTYRLLKTPDFIPPTDTVRRRQERR